MAIHICEVCGREFEARRGFSRTLGHNWQDPDANKTICSRKCLKEWEREHPGTVKAQNLIMFWVCFFAFPPLCLLINWRLSLKILKILFKWVLPLVVIAFGVLMYYVCKISDEQADRNITYMVHQYSKDIQSAVAASNDTQARLLFEEAGVKGYDRYRKDRLWADDTVYVTRLFPQRPALDAIGTVSVVESDKIIVTMQAMKVVCYTNGKPDVTAGDLVLVSGIGSDIEANSFILKDAKIAAVGVKKILSVYF